MWMFTTYILWKLHQAKRTDKIPFSDLVYFVFDILWKKYRILLNISSKELEREVESLRDMGAVDFDGNTIWIKNKLADLAKTVEASASNIDLSKEFIDKINQAVYYDIILKGRSRKN